jgi:hypothetical protein
VFYWWGVRIGLGLEEGGKDERSGDGERLGVLTGEVCHQLRKLLKRRVGPKLDLRLVLCCINAIILSGVVRDFEQLQRSRDMALSCNSHTTSQTSSSKMSKK